MLSPLRADSRCWTLWKMKSLFFCFFLFQQYTQPQPVVLAGLQSLDCFKADPLLLKTQKYRECMQAEATLLATHFHLLCFCSCRPSLPLKSRALVMKISSWNILKRVFLIHSCWQYISKTFKEYLRCLFDMFKLRSGWFYVGVRFVYIQLSGPTVCITLTFDVRALLNSPLLCKTTCGGHTCKCVCAWELMCVFVCYCTNEYTVGVCATGVCGLLTNYK